MEKLIINSNLKNQSEEKIQLIYTSLKRKYSKISDLSVYSGKMGVCLFFFYYEKLYGKKTSAQKLLNEINDYLSQIEGERVNYFNFSEFGWTLQLLKKNNLINSDIDDVLSEIDEALESIMIHLLNEYTFELLYGAINIANYFFYRNDVIRKHAVDLFIEALYKNAVFFDKEKISWLSYIDVRKDSDKHINLGIAHGVPAIILYLSKLKDVGYKNQYLDELLIKSCNYILSVEQDSKNHLSHFPYSINPKDNTDKTSRLAWCYGDLSVGYALLKASKHYNNIKDATIEILIDTTKRTNTAFDNDDCLCHGTIGIGHIYNRIYDITNNNVFKNAALYWYKKGLSISFKCNRANEIEYYNGEKIMNEYNLLDGIAGIGLSLISAISSIEPQWDECLLLS